MGIGDIVSALLGHLMNTVANDCIFREASPGGRELRQIIIQRRKLIRRWRRGAHSLYNRRA